MASSGVKPIRHTATSDPTVKAINNLESMWNTIDSIRSRLQNECLHERPQNSFTRLEYRRRYRVSESTARGQLEKMVLAGDLINVRVLLPDSSGRITPHNVYVPVTR